MVGACLANDGASSRLTAKALAGLGSITFFQGDYPTTKQVAERSLEIGRAVDAPPKRCCRSAFCRSGVRVR